MEVHISNIIFHTLSNAVNKYLMPINKAPINRVAVWAKYASFDDKSVEFELFQVW